MALKENGEKVKVLIVLEKNHVEYIKQEAAHLGLNISAYMRMIVSREMIASGKR